MKKKFSLFILCGIILFYVCGCDKNNSDIKTKDLKIDNLRKMSIVCDELKDIIDLSLDSEYFITKNGELYELNTRQLFSNDKNCRKVNTNIKISKFYRTYVLSSDNELYNITNNSLSLADKNETFLDEIIMIDKTLRPNLFRGGDNIYYYKDKNIYSTDKIDKYHYNISDTVVISLDEDEDVIYVIDNTIMTTKRIFSYETKIINQEECNKYVDIECKTQSNWFEVNDNIKNQLSNILLYKAGYAIDKKGNFYSSTYAG